MTADRDRLILDLWRAGVPIARVGEVAGVTHTMVYRVLRKAGEPHRRIVPWTTAEDALIRADTAHTAAELAAQLGRTRDAVKWRRSLLRRREGGDT